MFKPAPLNTAYLNPIILDDGAIEVASGFEQHVGHYTSPVLPLYSASGGATHTVFFGGTNQFTWDDTSADWIEVGTPPFIPFTDDIGVVSYASGAWSERRLEARMPGLLGTNAALFLDPALPLYASGVVDLDALPAGTTRVGWIVGGIEAGAPSFGQTWASERVLEVSLTRTVSPGTSGGTPASFRVAEAQPNPFRGVARIEVTVDEPQPIRAEAFDVTGRRVATLHDGPLAAGAHALEFRASGLAPGLYLVRVTGANGESAARLVVLAR